MLARIKTLLGTAKGRAIAAGAVVVLLLVAALVAWRAWTSSNRWRRAVVDVDNLRRERDQAVKKLGVAASVEAEQVEREYAGKVAEMVERREELARQATVDRKALDEAVQGAWAKWRAK